MTRELRDLKDIYPQGLNSMLVAYHKSLDEIMRTEEIDRIINYTPSSRERRWLKRYKKAYLDAIDDMYMLSAWDFFPHCESPELLKNIFCYMLKYGYTVKPEDLNREYKESYDDNND